ALCEDEHRALSSRSGRRLTIPSPARREGSHADHPGSHLDVVGSMRSLGFAFGMTRGAFGMTRVLSGFKEPHGLALWANCLPLNPAGGTVYWRHGARATWRLGGPVLPPGSALEGRYEIVRPIGRGGFGAVYEAIDRRLGTSVAVKECLVDAGTVASASDPS